MNLSIEAIDILKLLLAIIAGGLIGLEREWRDKAAGFRTMIFICVGSTLFTILSLRFGEPQGESTRIAANIVTGIGFLGAVVILREGGRVVGLTTAATIWLVAAIGMGIGAGDTVLAGAATLLALLVLWLFPILEATIDRLHDSRIYRVGCGTRVEKFNEIEQRFRECGLRIASHKWTKEGDQLVGQWYVAGPPDRHTAMVRLLQSDPEVRQFEV
jgi:putative Mg2+ transporter-C (MgtC) family protein